MNTLSTNAVNCLGSKYILNPFTILLSYYPVEVEAVDEGAHSIARCMGHQTFIQHFLHKSERHSSEDSPAGTCKASYIFFVSS